MSLNFVKRVNKEIHDINNNPFLLKGVGIGGWFLFEGYMFKSFGEIDRPSRFKNLVLQSTDESYYDFFFNQWYDTFITEEDVILIKEEGFNSIRVALDYQFLFISSETNAKLDIIEKNFSRLDTFISICKKHEVYVILDMHAAPGGQTGTNIDNSPNNRPELFENILYQEQLCLIWQEVANRYKNETIIAAYDLLNEPLPNWNKEYNELLIPLYKRVISHIRKVDTNHMITLEGLHWSTDWSCFNTLPDENILLQFHKYWSNPDIESLQGYLDVRDKLNVPIFMGEGGENNLKWYYTVFKLYEQLNISSNFWTYKKMDTHNSISSFQEPTNWSKFLSKELTNEESIATLNELLNNVTYSSCKINTPVINHLLQKNSLIIPGFGFDFLGKNISWFSLEKRKTSFRKNESVDIVNLNGEVVEPDFKQYAGEDYTQSNQLVVRLHPEEWVCYTFELDERTISINLIIDSDRAGFNLYLNDLKIEEGVLHLKNLLRADAYKLKIYATDLVVIRNIFVKSVE